jgi:Protein of unknown function (DUF1592)/Protein of unknown function (DUF1588)/Protein of unknown function (DUF1595)/Protein of unknown function (DUF1587)
VSRHGPWLALPMVLVAGCVTGVVGEPASGGAGGSSAACAPGRLGPRALTRLTASQLGNTLRDIFPEASGTYSLDLSDVLESKEGFVNPGKLLVGEDSADKLLAAATRIADAVTAPDRLSIRLPCAGSSRDATCAAQLIQLFGRRLFRRPVTADEQQRYLALYNAVAARSDFWRGARWVLAQMIQSPNTLYRREVGKPRGNGYHLDQYELASELAYTFTGTTPGEDLLDRAEKGMLGSPEALVATARGLLDSPAGHRAIGEFFRLWLGYDQVRTDQRDKVSDFAGVREKLVEEARQFLERVVYADRGGLEQLLTAPYTVIDAQLASYYGLPAPAAPGFGVVLRPSGQGVGLLALGAVLADRSQSGNSSPTKRGILVRRKLLCLDIPVQPPVVPDLPGPGAGWRTTRQRFEISHAVAACAVCHRQFDSLGFPLEHFDEAGRYRATENGEPIDASGSALAPDGTTLFSISNGEEELSAVLARRPEVAACVGDTLAGYLLSQAGDCLTDASRADFIAGKIGFLELAARLAGAPHFSDRKD